LSFYRHPVPVHNNNTKYYNIYIYTYNAEGLCWPKTVVLQPPLRRLVLQCVMLYIFCTRRVAHVRAYMIMRFGFVKNRYDTLGGGGGGVAAVAAASLAPSEYISIHVLCVYIIIFFRFCIIYTYHWHPRRRTVILSCMTWQTLARCKGSIKYKIVAISVNLFLPRRCFHCIYVAAPGKGCFGTIVHDVSLRRRVHGHLNTDENRRCNMFEIPNSTFTTL